MLNLMLDIRTAMVVRVLDNGFARSIRALIAFALLLVLAFAVSIPAPAYADGRASLQSSVLDVAKTYDKDAYHILKTQVKRGDDILKWLDPESWFVADFDTMVHEECHGYMARKYKVLSCYVGNKKRIDVKIGKVYRTKKMAKSIPKKLRSSRYPTYVAKPMKNLSSNVEGIYGLLNEYTAYCWGSTAIVNLYPFCKKTQGQILDMWLEYMSEAYGGTLARAEFRYFMEHYLVYAKKHYPKVYSSIMKNKRFKKAFRMVDRRFAKTASILDRRLEELASSIHDAGFNVYLDGDFLHISGDLFAPSVGLFLEEHNRLAKALAQKKYKAIEKKLGLTPVTEKAPKLMTREQAEAEWKNNHPDEYEEDDESMLLQAASVG